MTIEQTQIQRTIVDDWNWKATRIGTLKAIRDLGLLVNAAIEIRTTSDDEHPEQVSPVDVGDTVTKLSTGYWHSCAILSSGRVTCWGLGAGGRLGYGHEQNIGDDESPSAVGPIDL